MAGKLVPIEVRFWKKVEKTDGCWLWTGSKCVAGYGRIGQGGRHVPPVLAHRVSWELHFGPIPAGKCVLHKCDVPSCVRPSCLFLGTHRQNSGDAVKKGRMAGKRLTARKVFNMRVSHASGESIDSIAHRYGTHPVSVYKVVTRRTWKHVT